MFIFSEKIKRKNKQPPPLEAVEVVEIVCFPF
jgi:hypothetical protein